MISVSVYLYFRNFCLTFYDNINISTETSLSPASRANGVDKGEGFLITFIEINLHRIAFSIPVGAHVLDLK